MKLIGLTYDLRSEYLACGYSLEETAELDQEDTIDALHQALVRCGYEVERIGRVQSLVERLASGARWDLVFNIAEGLRGDARESQVPALLDAYAIPYTFSSPKVLACCLDKELCKQVLRAQGIATANWCVAASRAALDNPALAELRYPLFAKPVAEGTSKGVTARSKIADYQQLALQVEELLARFSQPVLIEEFLPGAEFTVALLGSGSDTMVFGILGISLLSDEDSEVYSFENKERCESLVSYALLDAADSRYREVSELAIAAWNALGCRDAGRVDIRYAADGTPSVIELNPLAGLHPTHSDVPIIATALGVDYQDLIGAIVNETWKRLERSEVATASLTARLVSDSPEQHDARRDRL